MRRIQSGDCDWAFGEADRVLSRRRQAPSAAVRTSLEVAVVTTSYRAYSTRPNRSAAHPSGTSTTLRWKRVGRGKSYRIEQSAPAKPQRFGGGWVKHVARALQSHKIHATVPAESTTVSAPTNGYGARRTAMESDSAAES
jgi:hypothetical protein